MAACAAPAPAAAAQRGECRRLWGRAVCGEGGARGGRRAGRAACGAAISPRLRPGVDVRLEHLQPGLHGEQQAVLNLQLGQLLVPLLQLLGEGRVAAAHKVLDQLHGPSRQDAVRCRGEAKADRGRTERVDGPALLWHELHRRLEQACSLRRLTQVLPGTFGPGRTTSVLGRLRGARRSRAERSAVEERTRRQRSRRREAR